VLLGFHGGRVLRIGFRRLMTSLNEGRIEGSYPQQSGRVGRPGWLADMHACPLEARREAGTWRTRSGESTDGHPGEFFRAIGRDESTQLIDVEAEGFGGLPLQMFRDFDSGNQLAHHLLVLLLLLLLVVVVVVVVVKTAARRRAEEDRTHDAIGKDVHFIVVLETQDHLRSHPVVGTTQGHGTVDCVHTSETLCNAQPRVRRSLPVSMRRAQRKG